MILFVFELAIHSIFSISFNLRLGHLKLFAPFHVYTSIPHLILFLYWHSYILKDYINSFVLTLFLFLRPFHLWPHRCSHCQNSLLFSFFFFNSGSQNSVCFFLSYLSCHWASSFLFCLENSVHINPAMRLFGIFLVRSLHYFFCRVDTAYLYLISVFLIFWHSFFLRDHITSLISLDTGSPYSVSLSSLTDSLH